MGSHLILLTENQTLYDEKLRTHHMSLHKCQCLLPGDVDASRHLIRLVGLLHCVALLDCLPGDTEPGHTPSHTRGWGTHEKPKQQEAYGRKCNS